MQKTFDHHTPSAGGLEKIKTLRQAYSDLLDVIKEQTPASREQSVAITHLETSAMWAIKGLIFSDPGSKRENPDQESSPQVVS